VFKTIVWATDGSPSALNALTVAKGLAQETGARLVIVHVEEAVVSPAGVLVDSDERLLAGLHRKAQEFQDEGLDADVFSARASGGGAARMIVDLAMEAGADLIVAGNRGHGPLAGIFLGSVALRLLQTAPCPVLMVPSSGQPA
jgi:nucleotide-binding universal stress UspA family protein